MSTAAKAALRAEGIWDAEAFDEARTPATAAGFVAFEVLTHDQGLGPDIARVSKLPLPAGADSEDMAYFLWDLLTAAGEIGYATAMVNMAGLRSAPAFGPGSVSPTVEEVGKAVAALLGRAVVDSGETFDLEYRAKVEALARKAAAA